MMKMFEMMGSGILIRGFSTLAVVVTLGSAEAQNAEPKSFAEFAQSAGKEGNTPAGLSDLLQSLWYSKAGQWEKAHEIAQDIKTPQGSWVHGFLHREEGDLSNAGYWYRQAGKTRPEGISIADEWSDIAQELWNGEKGAKPGMEVMTSSKGIVAKAVAAAKEEEGAWDTVLRQNGKELLRIGNARPISIDPSGKTLLLVDAAADDSCRHFLISLEALGPIPPMGKRVSIGGRYVSRHEWSKDGASLTLHASEQEKAMPTTLKVADFLTGKAAEK
jgi:hypothetical protein